MSRAPSTPSDAGISPDKLPGQPSPWGRRLVIAIAISLVAVPLLWSSVPLEVARWYEEAAFESELDNDSAAALAQLDRAISWCPNQPPLWVHRSQIQLKRRQLDDALIDCQRALELEPEDRMPALFQRLLVYQRQGNHQAALNDADAIVALAADSPQYQMSYDNFLNLRAYAHALAEIDIKAGLDDIAKALERQGANEVAAYIDTRGYLRYLDGDLDGALVDMERAVELAEERDRAFQDEPQKGDPRERDVRRRMIQEDLAVLYHHRGLVYQGIGQEEEARNDFRRALDNGYSPEDGVW